MADVPGAGSFRTSAESYERHIGRYGSALARALIEVADVSAGERVLDVGCGPGALPPHSPRLSAAGRVP